MGVRSLLSRLSLLILKHSNLEGESLELGWSADIWICVVFTRFSRWSTRIF